MSFASFLRLVKTLNIGAMSVLWLGFWGYGIAVQDVPPLSVVPGLLLVSICIIVAVTVAAFLLCHLGLFIARKQDGTFPPFKASDYIAVLMGCAGAGTLVLIDTLAPSQDALIPLAVLAGCACVCGFGYAATVFSSQFFRWQFSPSH